jgi:cysteine desulfuration protein SufE
LPTLADILADFDVIDDWEERYRYVIELGRTLEPLADVDRTDDNKVRGCASQVWLAVRVTATPAGPRLDYTGDSDAHIVKGLVAVMLAIYSGRAAAEILALDPEETFTAIGLREHLTPQRANGVNAMIERIRADARAALGGA